MKNAEIHTVQFSDSIVRDLPVVSVSETASIAYLKLYGDNELLRHCANELSASIDPSTEVLLGTEAGGILLTHLVSEAMGIPYVIARKKRRPHMVRPIAVPVKTIGTDQDQVLMLDDSDQAEIRGKRVTIIDEVLSSGATWKASMILIESSGGIPIDTVVVATEGDRRNDVKALVHLPLFLRDRGA